MERRQLLRATGALAGGGLAGGCAGCLDGTGDETPATGAPGTDTSQTGTPGDTPDGIYVQSFLEEMVMPGMATGGPYAFGLMLVVPHTFWTITGTQRDEVAIEDGDSVHLMSVVWDPESGTVLPEVGFSVEIAREGELVSEEVIYPMLSQRMGFHWGGNFPLPEDGTYTAKLSVGGMDIRRTGAFAGRFSEGASATVEFDWDDAVRNRLTTSPIEQAGSRGAVKPMDMGTIPQPTVTDLPKPVLGSANSDDAILTAAALTGDIGARMHDAEGPYLAVTAETRYNGLLLPLMGLQATVDRGGETVFEGALKRTLDSDLGYHYGAGLDAALESDDTVTVSVQTPPQVARHEGYETAFRQMDAVEFSVDG